LKGKILRLDVSGNEAGYAIPADNPFAGNKAARPEIWAYGLRNPYRPSFDRSTGDLYIADVGQDTEEEINFENAGGRGGRNYGWPNFEGRHLNPQIVDPAPVDSCPPLYSYLQSEMPALRAGVIGGYVYRGRALPELNGKYFFADFTNAIVRSFRRNDQGIVDFTDHTQQLNADGQLFFYSSVSSFAEDRDGELLLVDFAGSIFRLVRTQGGENAQR
jgi:glucose/arabinose dehydrogenase